MIIRLIGIIERGISAFARGIAWALLWIAILFGIQRSSVPIASEWQQLSRLTDPYSFDYIRWELGAISAKLGQHLWGDHAYLDESARSEVVRAYFSDLGTAQALEQQIAEVFSDPMISDPQVASQDLRKQRDQLRADLAVRQSQVEAILEGQVSAILIDLGFGTQGQLLPPMAMRFTIPPNILVISPRQTIRSELRLGLVPLTIDQAQALEQAIETSQDVSALVIPIGGMALYPAMIMESSYLPWVIEVFAHEWLHHYLYFFPLGQYLDFGSETHPINETAADLFGKEVVRLVLARYYPEYAVAPNVRVSQTGFDYFSEMRETRVIADRLLAEGRINAAEVYLEQRRAMFYRNGYPIRRLNQAYFAFYGDYQGGGAPGAAGQDPIGPAIHAIRAASPDLHGFVVIMRGIRTRSELLAQRERMETLPRRFALDFNPITARSHGRDLDLACPSCFVATRYWQAVRSHQG